MTFGILKEIKEGEFRVISTPSEVKSIVASGHEVWAQHDCGKAAGFPDEKRAEKVDKATLHPLADFGRKLIPGFVQYVIFKLIICFKNHFPRSFLSLV